MVRSLFVTLLLMFSFAQAVVKKECPQSIQLDLNQFQRLEQPDERGRLLEGYSTAFVSFGNLTHLEINATLEDISESPSAVCNYTTDNESISRFRLDGSVGSSSLDNRARMKIDFNYQAAPGVVARYAIWNDITSMNNNQELALASEAVVLFRGSFPDTSEGRTVYQYDPVGHVSVTSFSDTVTNCVNAKEAAESITGLMHEIRQDYPLEELLDGDSYNYMEGLDFDRLPLYENNEVATAEDLTFYSPLDQRAGKIILNTESHTGFSFGDVGYYTEVVFEWESFGLNYAGFYVSCEGDAELWQQHNGVE